MKTYLTKWTRNAQDYILRIFMESDSYSLSRANDYCLRAHCGTYLRMRTRG